MADSTKFYVVKGDKTLVEGMTKEQTLAAITQAVEEHEIHDVDTGFVTTLKETNRNRPLKFWVGKQAEYNAIQTPDEDTFYIISDSTYKEDIDESIADLQTAVRTLNAYNNSVVVPHMKKTDDIAEQIGLNNEYHELLTFTASGRDNYIDVWKRNGFTTISVDYVTPVEFTKNQWASIYTNDVLKIATDNTGRAVYCNCTSETGVPVIAKVQQNHLYIKPVGVNLDELTYVYITMTYPSYEV